MKIASTKPFRLRPYRVSAMVEDNAAVSERALPGALPVGRAILKSAAAGGSLIVATPSSDGSATSNTVDYWKLAKGVGVIAGETLTGKAVAKSAWQLSAMSSTTSADELAKTLISNHIAPDNAKAIADNALQVLHDPISKGILISISAGAATFHRCPTHQSVNGQEVGHHRWNGRTRRSHICGLVPAPSRRLMTAHASLTRNGNVPPFGQPRRTIHHAHFRTETNDPTPNAL